MSRPSPLRASLSAKGLKQSEDIMHLNETLAELNDNNFAEYGEGKYYLTVMGTPSAIFGVSGNDPRTSSTML